MCFSPLLKSTLSAIPNLSPPTVFDLGGWNGHHFVGNWVAETVTYLFFNIRSLSSKNMQHKKNAKNAIFSKKKFICFSNVYYLKIRKTACEAVRLVMVNEIKLSNLSVKLWEEIGFLQDPPKPYIFYTIRFLYVSQKKSWNKLCLEPHDTYVLFRMFFSHVNIKWFFFYSRSPFKQREYNPVCTLINATDNLIII